MNSSDRQLLILIAGVVFILVQALAINYKIWWLTFTASGMALLFAAFLPRAAALPTSKNDRPKAEDLAYGDVPTTEFTSTSLASTSGALDPNVEERQAERLALRFNKFDIEDTARELVAQALKDQKRGTSIGQKRTSSIGVIHRI